MNGPRLLHAHSDSRGRRLDCAEVPTTKRAAMSAVTLTDERGRVVFGAEHGTLWLAWEPKDANEAGTKVQTRAGVNL